MQTYSDRYALDVNALLNTVNELLNFKLTHFQV